MARYALVLALALVSGCGGKQGYDPFDVTPTTVYAATDVIVIAPLDWEQAGIEPPDTIIQALEFLVDSTLQAAGFSTVSSTSFSEIWDPIIDDIGGLYDPFSGRLIDDKWDSAHGRATAELRRRFNADAVMYLELMHVNAPYADGSAAWDGTSQSVATFWENLAEVTAALADVLDGTPHSSTHSTGTVPAVSLQTTLFNLDGDRLYQNWGGIQVIADKGSGALLEEGKLFSDRKRLRKSVAAALKQLVDVSDRRKMP